MKLLVCVSRVPDTTTKITFKDNDTAFNTDGVKYILNPYDEWYALVRAIELKEQVGGTVTAIHVGPATNDTDIRKALAIGADNAVRINAEPTSPAFVAAQVAAHAKTEGYDIVFTGKETIDYNNSSVGAMLAEMLDMPFVSFGTHMDVAGNTATIARDIEGGAEVVEVDTPFVLSASKGMAEQRIPNMRGIMMAKRKPLVVVEPIAFEETAVPVAYELPPAKTGVKLIDPENMDELVRLLHEEAKAI